jgi:hypothetical protein
MDNLNLNKEFDRLLTFKFWSDKLDPRTLAKFGFYYTGIQDIVKCQFCKVEIGNWDVGSIVYKEHKKWSTKCPFLCMSKTLNSLQDQTMNNLTTQVVSLPVNYKFACYNKRLESFVGWPNKYQDPVLLSMAGFYYLGEGDLVKCFSCGGGLKDWEKDDIPLLQHALHYKDCTFIKNIKSML